MKKSLIFIVMILCFLVCGCTSNNSLHRRQWWINDIEELELNNKKATNQVSIAIIDDGVKGNVPELEGRIKKHLLCQG